MISLSEKGLALSNSTTSEYENAKQPKKIKSKYFKSEAEFKESRKKIGKKK